MFDFSPTDEQSLIRETAERFARQELRSLLREHEKARGVSPEVLARYAATGLGCLDWPEEIGGQGAGSIAKSLALEALAESDPGAALALEGPGLAAYPLIEAGAAGILEGRSDARGVVIEDLDGRLRLEGGVLRGEHPWVPADDPGLITVLQGDRGWVVTRGFRVEPTLPCGLEAAGAGRVVFESAPIDATLESAGLERARARMRTYVAALLVGAARGAYRYALDYAKERTTFGRPIAHHQAVAFLLVDMAMAVEVGHSAVLAAAVSLDAGGSVCWEASRALAEAAEQSLFVGPNAVQLLGGHGFMKDHPVEKWMRDIRTLAQMAGGRDEAELALAGLVAEHEMGLR